ncbi:hypothetical protein ACFDR9_002831 [Janthinobacterium sp. CG_23.3]|uniref:hypothetical protein n=1 Tax=Janthinobacterium sp. CG_23.3 TaxID=3349634 RepID=UPI0038D3A07B
MKIRLPTLPTLSAMLLCAGAAAADNDFRCFTTDGPGKPIRLQFSILDTPADAGEVRYERGSAPIRVKQIKRTTLDEVPGRPSEFQTEWRELPAGGKGGKYVMDSQGARVYALRYVKPNGKTFSFREDPGAMVERGCDWSDK